MIPDGYETAVTLTFDYTSGVGDNVITEQHVFTLLVLNPCINPDKVWLEIGS